MAALYFASVWAPDLDGRGATPNMADIFELSDGEFEDMVLKAPRPVLLAGGAPWCGPCVRLEPILEQVAAAFAENVLVLKLNTDENPLVPRRLGIMSIPTLVFFRDGEERDRIVGFTSAAELKRRLEQALR